MHMELKEIQMMKLNTYAREYIDNYDINIDYQKITRQMKDFSGAELVMFNIFDENAKDFTLVGIEGSGNNIRRAMDIIGYNIVGKKFEYEEGRNERFEKSIVTKVESLIELVGSALPGKVISILESVFQIDHILTVRITKDEKTIGNFTLIFKKNQNRNDDEILKLFASQVGLFIDKKESEQKTLATTKQFQSLMKNSVSIITIVDNMGNYIHASDTAAKLIGLPAEELIGKNFLEVLPEKNEEFMYAIATINKTKKPLIKKEIYTVNNQERIYESIVFPIEFHENEVVLLGSIANDITDKIKYENQIKNERDYIYRIFNAMNQYVIVTGLDYRIQFMNEKAIKDFGDMKGKVCYKQLDSTSPCGACRLHEFKHMTENETITYTVTAFNRVLEINASRIENLDDSVSIVEVIDDITDKEEKQRQIEYMNLHDHLTGLYNRRFFEEELKRLDVDRNLPLSIITIDVNGLKLINDTLGHAKGDEVLIKSAKVIKNSLRADEITARVGGDEFSSILPKCDAKQVIAITERIVESIEKETEEGIPLSLAIGSHTKTHSSENILDILKKAENKMYANKIFSDQSNKREIILAILYTLHEKHPREEEHSKRVSQLAYDLGKAMKMKGDKLNMLSTAGLLHDIGKIAIDYSIIDKSEKLTSEEYGEVKKHPEIGYRILKNSVEYEDMARLILYHHERVDGNGYPKGVKGDEIPMESKIISIVDAYDAMISTRPYKTKILTKEEAIHELRKCSNAQFDSAIVEVFINEVIQ